MNTASQNPPSLSDQFVEESVPIGLPWRILIFSIILFLFIVLIYFGIKLGYSSYLDSREKSLDQKIQQLSNQVAREDQDRLVSFYSQLTNLKKALDRHTFGSNIFSFLEKNTIGTVYWNTANVIQEQSNLSLQGHAVSLESVVEQLSLFDKTPELQKVVVEQISFDKDGVNMILSLSFAESYFNQPTL